jgi:hypothetical protein
MVDIGAIAGAMSSLNTAMNIVKAMRDLRDWNILQSKIRELNEAIIDAQGKIFAINQERSILIERVSELEKLLAAKEEWSTQKDRYALAEIGPGAFAYAAKPDARGAEPPHYICGHCYEAGKKALLSHMEAGMGHVLSCPSCQQKMLIARGAYRPPT